MGRPSDLPSGPRAARTPSVDDAASATAIANGIHIGCRPEDGARHQPRGALGAFLDSRPG